MRKRILKIIVATITIILLSFISCNTQTYTGRWMTWRASDIMDYEKFPSYPFKASNHPFKFKSIATPEFENLAVSVTKNSKKSLEKVLIDSETTAFLVIKNDTIIYETYLNGYNRESMNTSFSVAKSITSLMIGKAIDDGLIRSVDDLVTYYLPEFSKIDSKYDKLTVGHLLEMRSGIQFKDHDLPWGDKPKAYYHPKLRERLRELPILYEPGSKFQYNSYNPILAGMILERTCGQSPAEYFEEKIWNKLGMEYSGSWSMDSEESRMTKMESGLNLRAIDFAKLGRLVLNKGDWNGEQVISQEWMEACQNVSQENQRKEFGAEIHYSNFWWLFSKDHTQAYIISGWGHLGQYLYLFPYEGIIIVRMGKDIGKVDSWKTIFQEIADHSK